MRRILLIDGENLVYGLRTLMGTNEDRAERSVIDGYNFRGLFEEILQDNKPTEMLWFGAKLRVYDENEEIRIKSESAVRQQSYFMNDIQRQRITFIKVGYLRAREIECQQGHNFWKLTEKGVDVGLAVRIISEADSDTEIVVVSADTDLLPAFKAAAKLGARLIHIGYEYRPIASLSHAANATRTITIPLATKYSKTKNI
ncbi:NYN domain-containing protein [Candidatus Saccharibacteria bacterium]|nr:MAG: NYN domain-containing protein [Candidatus Saccharibacteria bacterium]